MLRIATDPPVAGENFFDRETEQRRLWELLHQNHVLLLSPRRVGKTSLMYKLSSDAPAHQVQAIYQTCESIATEAQLVRELYAAVARQPGAEDVLDRLRRGKVARFFRRVRSFKGIALSELPDDAWQELGTELASSLRALDGHWLIMIDELPLLVLKLLRKDESGERVRDFLHWLRTLRQGAPGRRASLHWLLAGSIGLDTLTRRLGLGDTINDLTLYHLRPFSTEVAHTFLATLGAGYSLELSEEVRQRICDKAGWLIPYYLQLFFATLREHCDDARTAPTTADVDRVFEDLLSPGKRAYFDFWSQRLRDELGKPDAQHAHELLTACARDRDGATVDTLTQVLATHIADERQREASRRYLIDVLLNDGYLVQQGERFRFHSELLRESWLRSFGP